MCGLSNGGYGRSDVSIIRVTKQVSSTRATRSKLVPTYFFIVVFFTKFMTLLRLYSDVNVAISRANSFTIKINQSTRRGL